MGGFLFTEPTSCYLIGLLYITDVLQCQSASENRCVENLSLMP